LAGRISAVRAPLAILLLLAAAVCAGATPGALMRAAQNDELLLMAGVDLEAVEFRISCTALIIVIEPENRDPPTPFGCVYVQSRSELNLFSLEGDYLISELQLKLRAIDGVALQETPVMSQLQLFSGNRRIAIHAQGKVWLDRKKTQAAYRWLVDHSVPARQPVPWIGS
jgi:hypothetical protein